MLDNIERTVLRRYTKAICHLSFALRNERLGFILGAGVSDDLEIPTWGELLDALEAKIGFDGSKLTALNLTVASNPFNFSAEIDHANLKVPQSQLSRLA